MRRQRCRCRKCDARKTLTKHPDAYVRQPRCHNCGARDWRPTVRRQENCACGGYHFIHRKGSKFCEHHPAGFANRVREQAGATADHILDALLDCPGRPDDPCSDVPF